MTKVSIRIIDHGQSRRPNWFRSVGAACLIPLPVFFFGVIADSAAMQWVGFVIFACLSMALVIALASEAMTIEEARAKLDELEAKGKEK